MRLNFTRRGDLLGMLMVTTIASACSGNSMQPNPNGCIVGAVYRARNTRNLIASINFERQAHI